MGSTATGSTAAVALALGSTATVGSTAAVALALGSTAAGSTAALLSLLGVLEPLLASLLAASLHILFG